MAKNSKTERIGFDDYDFDNFGDFELGGFEDTAPVKNDRSPVAQVAGSFVKGSAEALQNQDFQRTILKHALPDGYLRTYNSARNAQNVLQDIRYEARTGLDNLVDTTKRTIQPLTSKLDRVLPKEMADQVKAWSKNTRKSNYSSYDPREYQRAEMQDTLQEIFGGWDSVKNEVNKDRSNQTMTTDAAIDVYNEDVHQKLQSANNEELSQIRVILERGQDYNNKVSHRFREKSLEVAYKTMWSVSTIADLTKQNMEQQKAANDRLVKNTALPEIVKMHNSELAWQLMKERSFGGIVDGVGNTFDSMRRRIVEKTRKELNSFYREAVGAVSSVGMIAQTMGGDDFDDYDPNETAEERRRRKAREDITGLASTGAEFGGELFAERYGKKFGEWVKKNYGDHPNVERIGLALSNFIDSAPNYMNDALDRNKRSGSVVFDEIRNMLGLDTLRYKEETSVRKSSLEDLDQMAAFNVRTQRTINEIIPGWLSRIHNEIRMHRTGATDLDPLRWSFESNSFEESSKSLTRLKNQLFDPVRMGRTSDDIDNVLNEIDPEGKLSETSRKHLRKFLTRSVYSPDQRITLEALESYTSNLDNDAKIEISGLRKELTDNDISIFDGSILDNIKSDFSGSREEQKRRARILSAMDTARSGLITNGRQIINRAKAGDIDILAQSGLLEQNEKGEWHTSNESMIAELDRLGDRVGPRSNRRRGFATGGNVGSRKDMPGDSSFVRQAKAKLRKLSPSEIQATLKYVELQSRPNVHIGPTHRPHKEFVKAVPEWWSSFIMANRNKWTASLFPLIREFANAPDGVSNVDISSGLPSNNRSGQGGPTGTSNNDLDIAGVTHANEHVIRAQSAQQPGAREFLNEFNSVGMQALDLGRDKVKGAISGNPEATALMEKTNDLLKGVQIAVSDMAMNGVSIDPNPDVRARKRRFTKALVKKHFNAKDILSPSFVIGTVATGGGYAAADLSYRGYKFAKDYAAREALEQSDIGINVLERLTVGMEETNPKLRSLIIKAAKGGAHLARKRTDMNETLSERQGEMIDRVLDRLEERKAKAAGTDDTRKTVDTDGDGLRDGSWQEDKARKAAEAANAGKNPNAIIPPAQIAKKSGMLGLVTSLVGMVGSAIPIIGSIASWGTKLFSWGGTALNLLKALVLGKGVGGGGVGGAGRRGARYGRKAMGLVGKLGVAGKIAGLGAAAYGGYKLSGMGQPNETETVNVGYGIKREFDIPEGEREEQTWGDKALEWGGHGLTAWSAASLANMATGGAVYTGLGKLAVGAASLLTAPVLIGAAVVGAVAVGGYLLYKKIKSDSSYCLNFRMAQYGFSYKNKDAVANVLGMEEYLLKHTTVSKGRPAAIGRSADMLELLKIFKIDPKDKDASARFVNWLGKRAKPVFLGALTAYFNLTSSAELHNADTALKDAQKIEYINNTDIATTGPDTPYNEMANPMPKATVLQMDSDAVGNYKSIALSKLKSSADESKDKVESKKNLEKEGEAADKKQSGGKNWQDETKERADSRRESLGNFLTETVKNTAMFMINPIGGALKLGHTIFNAASEGFEKLTGKAKDNQLAVYKAFRAAGLSDEQAKIATAEVGRENDYLSKYLFGGHNDPANGKYNLGFISWQKDRGAALFNFLKTKGLIDSSNKIKQSQEALNAQAEFMINEINTKPEYRETKQKFLDNPKVDYDTGTRVLGKNYIRWRYDDQKYAKHHQRRNNHYANLLDQLKDNPSAVTNTPSVPSNAAAQKQNPIPFKQPDPKASQQQLPAGVKAMAGQITVPDMNKPPTIPAGAQPGIGVLKPGVALKSAAEQESAKALLDPKLIEYGQKQAVRQNDGVNLKDMNQEFMKYVYALIGEWSKANGGAKATITSAYRSKEKQAALYYKYKHQGGNLAAPPGRSKHEFGIAIDISTPVANSMANQGLLTKYGFTRPLLGAKPRSEPFHLEHKLFGKPNETNKAVADGAAAKAKPVADKKAATPASTARPAAAKSPVGTGSNGQPLPTPPTPDQAAVGSRSYTPASTAATPRVNGDRTSVPANADQIARQQLEVMNSMNSNLVKISDTLVRIEKGNGMSPSAGPEDSNAAASKIANAVAQSVSGLFNNKQKSQDLRPPVSMKS